MNKINIQYYQTQIGDIILGSFDGRLCLLDFKYKKTRKTTDNRIKKELKTEFCEHSCAILEETKQQLDTYLSGDRKTFDIPFLMVGSDFQKIVWNALLDIPYGSTSTYLQIAKNINNKKAVRAVGNANGANAIALIIPCHRIIGENRALVGYGGGLPVKKYLLDFEGASYIS